MRGLSKEFMSELKEGKLNPFLELVKNDSTLDLEIRENTISIYYRGGRLYEIKPENSTGENYTYYFDEKYFASGFWDGKAKELYSQKQYYEAIPFLKSVMDRHMDRYFEDRADIHKAVEKETQQIIVRENNIRSSNSKKNIQSVAYCTDYYIVDIEYDNQDKNNRGRFDLLAVRYLSESGARRKRIGQLAVIEVKYGDTTISGTSGIEKHIRDAEEFFSKEQTVRSLRDEALMLYNQKLELGLLHAPKDPLEGIDGSKPEYILLLANHDPAKSDLFALLAPYAGQIFETFDLKVATASGMGYGLYSDRIVSVEEFIKNK